MEDDTQVLDLESRSIAGLQETRADRLRQSVTEPDFSPSNIQTTKDVLSESTMVLSDTERQGILRSAGVYASTGKQVSTAIENALIGMNQLPDEMTIAFGNIANYITGGALGEELQNIAYESMAHRYAAMADNEDAIGGIRSELAQLAGGATSFLQLALESVATAGVLPNVHIGIQAFGEGAYNDMKAYADKHDGSLEGYKPKGFDLAVNTANALLQTYIEEKFGVGSPRFFVGASRGLVKEGLSGALQEAAQGALADLAEAVKGNEDISILLENADQYARDAIIGGILQGAMGAATYHQNYAKATNNVANAIAKARGRETPTAEDQQQAETIIDAKERGYASALTTEFKAVFDASTGEGKLQQNIAAALKKAVETQELDLGVTDETELAQKLEQVATQETLNAMDMAREQGKSVAEMELNNIVYRDGAIWLEGTTPQLGERAADYARVLAERQSGLAEAQTKLDTINQEVQQTKKDLAEAKAQSKQAMVDKLQARLDKQNALAEKRKIQTEKLKAQTAKIEAQIVKELGSKTVEPQAQKIEELAKPKEPLAKVAERSKKYNGEKRSLKQERSLKEPEQQFLFQQGVDNRQNGAIITGQGGGNAKANNAVGQIRRAIHQGNDGSVWTDTSAGDSGAGKASGVRNLTFTEQTKEALKQDGYPAPEFVIYDNAEAGAQEYLDAMKSAVAELGDKAASVDVKKLKDYKDMKALILTKDKKTGCAVTKDGDIVSLFSSSTERHRTVPLLLAAIQSGGKKLDCFDIYLPSLYSKVGFKAVARNNWVEKYKPAGWDKEYFKSFNNGEPDVVFMVYDPSNTAAYKPGDGRLIKSDDVDADYGAGMAAQDEALANIVFQQAQELQRATLPTNQMLRQEEAVKEYDSDTIEVDGVEHTVYNSDGERIAKSAEALTNFWRWFGDSKAVDKDGRPLVVYHGTGARFDTFDLSLSNRAFFTDSKIVADTYQDFRGKTEASNTVSVYLKLKNPLFVDFGGKGYVDIPTDIDDRIKEYLSNRFDDLSEPTLDEIIDYAIEDGEYDGVIAKNIKDYAISDTASWEAKRTVANDYIAFEPNQIKSVDNIGTFSPETGNILNQSKVEGTGSDKYRGGYDEKLKRIVLGEKSDLTTIQHEFAHYWIQNNFKWARSGLASQEWLRKWRDVEDWLGIEPQDRLLSRQASEKFARAYEQYILQGKVSEDLQWAFDGFQKFYADTYEDLENEYFDLSEELDQAVVDWFNRQRPATEQALKDQSYKTVAQTAMAEGADIITETAGGDYIVSSMNEQGEVTSDVVVNNTQAEDSKLAQFSDKKKNRRVIEGLRESNPDIKADQYNVLNRAATVEEAHNWIVRDRDGAWAALNNPNTNPIDRAALFQAFKNEAENGDYALGAELAGIKFPKEMTELGQAISVLGERPEFDPLTILEEKQKSLGEPTAEELTSQTDEMKLDADLDAEQVKELEETTECVL